MRSLALLFLSLTMAAPLAQSGRDPAASAEVDALHRPFDQILDLQVRDGLVYYRALRGERARLDRYVASLDLSAGTLQGWSRERQLAYWLNAYNAFVLQTVLDHYPIRGRHATYPANSIRQIPGAFEKRPHRAGGRTVTLDEIEKTILPAFKEPRAHLALGRGAIGSGRLRSEAYSEARLASQLDAVQAEFVTERTMLSVDRGGDHVTVTPIMSWHEAEFVAAYDKGAEGPYAQRSPIERALVAFILPHLLPLEREFVQRNTFRVSYHPFDWRLNDLSGGRVD